MRFEAQLDFLETCDAKRMLVADTSSWAMCGDAMKKMYVKVPNSNNYIDLFLETNKINILDSKMLGLTCGTCKDLSDLPDGLYEVKLEVCGNEYVFYNLRVTSIKNKIAINQMFDKDVAVNLVFLDIAKKMVCNGLVDEGVRIFNRVYGELNKKISCRNC